MAAEKKESLPGIELFFKKDKYYFQYLNEDGEPIFFSHGYSSDSAREKGIEAFIRACQEEEHFHSKKTKKKRHFFELKSGNNKKLGRSAQFDSEEDMQEAINLLRESPADIPVFQQEERKAEDEEEKTKPAAEEVQKSNDPKPSAQNVRKEADDKSSSGAGPREKMPRYRFSMTYYPDSSRWVLKHEATGETRQLRDCHGPEIEAFLRSQVPSEKETRKAPATKTETPPVQPPASSLPSSQDLSLTYSWYSQMGEKLSLKGAAPSKRIGGIQLALAKGSAISGAAAEVKVDIKSITHPSKGISSGPHAVPSHFPSLYVPLPEVYQLDPGMYRIHFVFHYQKAGEERGKLESSDLVMLT
jgi:uncharacterized protein YegP (UPF0339 family)